MYTEGFIENDRCVFFQNLRFTYSRTTINLNNPCLNTALITYILISLKFFHLIFKYLTKKNHTYISDFFENKMAFFFYILLSFQAALCS